MTKQTFYVGVVVSNIKRLIKEYPNNLLTYLTLLERNLSEFEKAQVKKAFQDGNQQ